MRTINDTETTLVGAARKVEKLRDRKDRAVQKRNDKLAALKAELDVEVAEAEKALADATEELRAVVAVATGVPVTTVAAGEPVGV